MVFDLCMQKLQQYVELNNATSGSEPQDSGLSTSLIRSCLRSLKTFMSWIPLGYIFETPLITAILEYYLKPVQFRQITLDCLLEVSNLNLDYGDETEAKYIK